MAVDKKLFYASHGLEYPVVARPYTDMEVKEKFFTKDEVIAMLTDTRTRAWMHHSKFDEDRNFEIDRAIEDIVWFIDVEIAKLKENI